MIFQRENYQESLETHVREKTSIGKWNRTSIMLNSYNISWNQQNRKWLMMFHIYIERQLLDEYSFFLIKTRYFELNNVSLSYVRGDRMWKIEADSAYTHSEVCMKWHLSIASKTTFIGEIWCPRWTTIRIFKKAIWWRTTISSSQFECGTRSRHQEHIQSIPQP